MSDAGATPVARRDLWITVLLVVLTYLVYSLSPNATPFDSRWTIHTAMSIIHEGDTNLDEYAPLLERDRFYGIECVKPGGSRVYPVQRRSDCAGGHYYNLYPVAVPLLAAPVVAAMETGIHAAEPLVGPLVRRASSKVVRHLLRGDLIESSAAVELLVASLFVALTAGLLYLAVRELVDRGKAALLTLTFAFCTPAWSLASRGLWQHGPSMLMLTIALLLALRAERRPGLIHYLGAPLALAFFIRPTNAIAVAVFSLFVWKHYRKQFFGYLLAAAPVTAVFCLYDLSVYRSWLAPYFSVQRMSAGGAGLHGRFLEALAGNLVSPSRGLLVYVPLTVLSIYGLLSRPRRAAARRLRRSLTAIIVLHWVLISAYPDWWGGHGYGPRYFSDMTPYLVYFLIPALEKVRWKDSWRRIALPAGFGVLAAASFFIHFEGATRWACWEWNSKPVEIHRSEWRIWDWRDPAFLRGVREGRRPAASAPGRGGPPSTFLKIKRIRALPS